MWMVITIIYLVVLIGMLGYAAGYSSCLNALGFQEGEEILKLWNQLPNEIETNKDTYFRTFQGEWSAYKSVTGGILFEVPGTMSLKNRLQKMVTLAKKYKRRH